MSIVCAISGEIPDVPTVSHVSGHVFEKRLQELLESDSDKNDHIFTIFDLF